MAKAKNTPLRNAPETMDIIDYLTEQMTTRTGIPFVRDAWVNAAPEQYGVVELGDVVSEQWADGKLIDCIWAVNMYLFVNGSNDAWPDAVTEALDDIETLDVLNCGYNAGRQFDIQTGKVQWTWNLRVYGPLIREVAAGGQAGD